MERVLISQISKHEGKEVLLMGRVINLRKLGSIYFVILQDRSATIQVVFEKEIEVRIGDSVKITGNAKSEPRAKGGFEIAGDSLEIIAASIEELPFDLSKPELNLQLNTLLDYRPLSLRHPKIQAIFKLYDILLKTYAQALRDEGFTEIKTPKLLGAATEGGANFFEVKYFEQKATLAQSPQFYKQIMVGVFERVFEVGPVFRAEPHFTTRHINEYISLDAEMGCIESFRDVTAMLNKVIKKLFSALKQEGQEYLKMYNAEIPEVPDQIPHIKLSEIKKIIKEKYKYEIPSNTDIDPEGERLAGRWAKEEHNSDFLFITNYPRSDRPFYTMPSKDNPEETEGFDLIFRGVELVTGSQRIHDYHMLIESMRKKKIKPEGMEFYLNTFKYAMPPHGGWGMGSERLIYNLLGLDSVKEAVLFPRDVKRLSP